MARGALPVLLALLAFSVLALLFAVATGSSQLSLTEIFTALLHHGPAWPQTLVWELRLPRAIAAFTVGGLLALAGALMQVLLRNPLADPYVLGTSGGAAVGALIALLTGLSGLAVEGLAFTGALASTWLVFQIGGGLRQGQGHRLLLTGIVMAAGWGAIIIFLLTITPSEQLHSLLFWLMGDLNEQTSSTTGGLALIIMLGLAFGLGRRLNLLVMGTTTAASLGVAIRPTLIAVYVLAALATAVAVSQAGSIGFIGLIIPHLVRLLGLRDQRLLLPGSVLAGGSMLVIADTFARTLLAPQQLPVGVLTAFIGIPIFLWLLIRQAGTRSP